MNLIDTLPREMIENVSFLLRKIGVPQKYIFEVCEKVLDVDRFDYFQMKESVKGWEAQTREKTVSDLKAMEKMEACDYLDWDSETLSAIIRSKKQKLVEKATSVLQKKYKCRYEGTDINLDAAFFERLFDRKKTAKGIINILDSMKDCELILIIETLEGDDYVTVNEVEVLSFF